MTRYQLLAAEIYGYSYANYEDHLGIGNVRYEQIMPDNAKTLELAAAEKWPLERVARELEVDNYDAADLLDGIRRAKQVVDAENPAEAVRQGVRQSIKDAVEDGLNGAKSIEQLVIQICYRTADLAFLLKRSGQSLSRYSRHLRREPEMEYYDG